jgi:hypothetical protein
MWVRGIIESSAKEKQEMRFAVNIPNIAIYSDPRLIVELAYEAEESGWDGFFIWDHIDYKLVDSPGPLALADPWIGLTAIAMRTKRIKLGPMVTPLPRRRPWKVAREAATLDHLSGGRLIIGVGLGGDRSREYSEFGEVADPQIHGEMLDDGLEVVTRLWSGEEINYEGRYYQLSRVQFLPKPRQQPRIPLWIAGFWPNKKPFRRAAKWDGVCPLMHGCAMTPSDFREGLSYIQAHRSQQSPFDVVTSGQTSGSEKARDAALIASFAEVGVTWWQECFTLQNTLEQVHRRIRLGPPQV